MDLFPIVHEIRDPIRFAKVFWPHVTFFKEQRDIIYSVEENDETYVPAAHQVGKDFVTAFIVLRRFLCFHPCRIITTSVRDDHLRVLWGEIGRFIDTCRFPLVNKRDGPLIVKHHDLRKIVNGLECKISYLRGMVSEKPEGMAGHHAAHTLFVADEASGVEDDFEKKADTWAHRKLIIGNPYPCQNFFRRGVKAGSLRAIDGSVNPDGRPKFLRKVIRIRASDSPNVRLALLERARGLPVSHTEVVPGVVSYREYRKRRAIWDQVRQCVGLDGEFWEGADELMYPPEWLNRAAHRAREIRTMHRRTAKAIGIDSAEGGDKTAMAAGDEHGLIEMISRKTADTSVIPNMVIAFGRKHSVPATRWYFDPGGGGKQHADYLRARGHDVQTVPFGVPVSPPPKHGRTLIEHKILQAEERYTYFNRRAQMYGMIRERLDPLNEIPYGLPDWGPAYEELRRQLSVIPLVYDREGRMKLPPKRRIQNRKGQPIGEKSLEELIGHSPDEADALALMVYGVFSKKRKAKAGKLF